jgi:hypothetical protein
MRRIGILLCALAALSLASGAALAAGRKGKPAGNAKPVKAAAKPAAATKSPIPGDIPDVHVSLPDLQTVLTSEIKLADDQKAGLGAKIAAAQATLAKWDKDNAARRDAGIAALEKAREGADSAASDAAMAKVQAFQAEREKLEADQQAEALSVLSEDQRAAWQGYKLYAGLLSMFGRFDLDLGQMEKMRGLAGATAKDLAGAADEAAKADARKKLMNAIQADVLTQPQRDKIAGKADDKTPKPAAFKKAGGGRKPAGDAKAKPGKAAAGAAGGATVGTADE